MLSFFEKIKFVVTGSRAYGPYTADSDLDIVVLKVTASIVKYVLNKLKIGFYLKDEQYDTTGSFYFKLGTFRINIIIATNNRDFNLWKYRTEMMMKIGPIHDRGTRIDVFRSLFPTEIGIGYVNADKESFRKGLFGWLSKDSKIDADDPTAAIDNPLLRAHTYTPTTPCAGAFSKLHPAYFVNTAINLAAGASPQAPTVDEFTYAQWIQANPDKNMDDAMLLNPRFAVFHALIMAKRSIFKKE